jgi:phosphatidate phosphatase APP1
MMGKARDMAAFLGKLAGSPARGATTAARAGGMVLQAYRGYGSRTEAFLIGRVYEESWGGFGGALGDLVRRLARRGVADARVTVRCAGVVERVATDRDGYFRAHLHFAAPPPEQQVWHAVELELTAPVALRGEGVVFLAPSSSRYVVISDIDDTVMHTGVGNKAAMLWRLFLQGAEDRVAFPGVAALWRAFHAGAGGDERNPMLYVSRAPWSSYDILERFFRLHEIPVGPVLFLREWGLTLQSPMPRRGRGHKLELIRSMLGLYRDLPFVLVGDSGQRDPEIYAQVVRENPGRVRAIYIRNVSRDPDRAAAVARLAAEVAAAGSTLLLAADTAAMAEHAASHGLIAPMASPAVEDEAQAEGAAPGPTPTVAVRPGDLPQALAERADEGPPANVVVEAGVPDGRAAGPGGR